MASKNDDIESKKCLTPVFRVSFPQVFEPKAYKNNDPRYSLVAMFEKDIDLSVPAGKEKNSLNKIIRRAIIEKWGPKDKGKWPKKLRLPFRDGDAEDAENDNYAGYNYATLSCKATRKPILVDAKARPILDEEKFYAGCYAHAIVIAGAYDEGDNRGVKLTVLEIQKVKDGEPLGRGNGATSFSALSGADDDDEDDTDVDDDEDDDDDAGF